MNAAAKVRQGDRVRAAQVTVSPLPASRQASGLMLVTFEAVPEQHGPAAPSVTSPGSFPTTGCSAMPNGAQPPDADRG